jgi:ribosomal protein S18 acetylase RimI-like enzyme
MMKHSIDPLTPDHAEVYAALRASVDSPDIRPMVPNHSGAVLQQYCEDGRLALGYWDEGKLLGACLSTFYGKVTKIELILVHPAYRRQGIGKALLDEVDAINDEQGCEYVMLYCASHDVKLLDWYRTNGFQVEDCRKDGYCVLKRYPRGIPYVHVPIEDSPV